MTITIETINDLHAAHVFRRLADGRLECIDTGAAASRNPSSFVDTSKPIRLDTTERWAWLPLVGGGSTSTYPAWALLMAVAFGMRIETAGGTFDVTAVDV